MTRIFIFIVFLLVSQSYANAMSECDLSDIDNFPASSCSFKPPFEVQRLKFGNLDDVINSGESIFIGAARYELSDDVDIYDAGNTDCDYDYDELANEDEDQEIAFIVSETDTREIMQLWLLNCTVDIAR